MNAKLKERWFVAQIWLTETNKTSMIITEWKSCPCRTFKQDKQFAELVRALLHVAANLSPDLSAHRRCLLYITLRGNMLVLKTFLFPAAESFNWYWLTAVSVAVSRVRSISSIMPSQLNDSRKVKRAVNEIDKFRQVWNVVREKD